MNQWYYFLGIVVTVAGLVTAFWKWYYGQKFITKDETVKLIDERSYSRMSGEKTTDNVSHLTKKIDQVLDSQKNVVKQLAEMDRKMFEELNEIKIEFAKLITEHNAFKHLHKVS